MEAKYGNNILYVSILFCCGRSASTSCATDLDRLRLCINCPIKTLKEAMEDQEKMLTWKSVDSIQRLRFFSNSNLPGPLEC